MALCGVPLSEVSDEGKAGGLAAGFRGDCLGGGVCGACSVGGCGVVQRNECAGWGGGGDRWGGGRHDSVSCRLSGRIFSQDAYGVQYAAGTPHGAAGVEGRLRAAANYADGWAIRLDWSDRETSWQVFFAACGPLRIEIGGGGGGAGNDWGAGGTDPSAWRGRIVGRRRDGGNGERRDRFGSDGSGNLCGRQICGPDAIDNSAPCGDASCGSESDGKDALGAGFDGGEGESGEFEGGFGNALGKGGNWKMGEA